MPSPRTLLDDTIAAIAPVDETVADAARARWDGRAKPPGSLGRIESVGVRLASITGSVPPPAIETPAVAVFAGDHGVVADGASAWPSEVTALMATNMAAGAAAINAFASVVGAPVHVTDVGVAADLSGVEGIVDAKVRAGTASLARGAAMTVDEAVAALGVGIDTAGRLVDDGADLLVGGDMGIGNTTPSAILIAHFADADAVAVTGPGAGLPAEAMRTKRTIVADATARIAEETDPLAVLAEVGGLEIAALAGLFLGAAARRVPVIVDGVIALAGACVAASLAPAVVDRLIAGHRSTEPAATVALHALGLDPVLDLDLRLGEGTGACLAVPLVRAAAAAMRDMADLPG